MVGPRFILAILAVAGAILSGCADNDPVRSTEPDKPLFKLVLLDPAAQPADGFEVGFINHSEFLSKPSPTPMSCPSTDIEFSLPAAGTVWLDVADYYGRSIQSLIDGEHRDAGSSTVRWDGADSTGAAVIPGFYQLLLRAVSASADTTRDTTWLVLETAPSPTMVGRTTDGLLAIDDTLLLPCLLGDPPIVTVSDGGSAVEVGDFYQDSVTIFIQSPNETTWYFARALIVGENNFVIDLSRYYEGDGVL